MRRTIRRRITAARHESGSVMIIALLVLMVAGVAVSAILAQAQVNLLHSSTTRAKEDRNYAAEAGLEWGIQSVRRNATLCTSATSTSVGTITFNNQTVDVTCKVTAGSVDVAANSRYALVTKNAGGSSLITQSGSAAVGIQGPVYLGGGASLAKPVSITGGFVVQKFSSCPNSTPFNSNLSATGGLKCTVENPVDPAIALPTFPTNVASSTGLSTTNIGGVSCRVFGPGRYNSPPILVSGNNTANYFASGVYYFGSGTFDVPNTTTVVAGARPSNETALLTNGTSACFNDSNAGSAPGVSGPGAVFIFGGNAGMTVGNNTAVELFSRTMSGIPTSVMAVQTTNGSYVASTGTSAASCSPFTSCVIGVSTGGAGFTAHGMIYAPTADVALFASNSAVAAGYGGVFVDQIMLQASNAGSGLSLSVTPSVATPSPPTLVFTAKASRSTGGKTQNGAQSAEAVIQIANDTTLSGSTAVVKSWRTVGVP